MRGDEVPLDPAGRRGWLKQKVKRLPLEEHEAQLLIEVASHKFSVCVGDQIFLEHPSATLQAMAGRVGVSDRHLRRRTRVVLLRYHGVLAVNTNHTQKPPRWIVSLPPIIAAPAPPKDLYKLNRRQMPAQMPAPARERGAPKKVDQHERWRDLHEDGRSWASIAKLHFSQTGHRVTRHAVAKAVKRLRSRR